MTTATHDADVRSSQVQSHGRRVSGTVLAVQMGTRTSFSKNYGFRTRVTSSAVTVHLDEAIQGTRQTTVHSPKAVALTVGAPVTVLIDPRDPTYAELPGKPLHASWGWVLLLVGSMAAWLALIRTMLTGARPAKASRRSAV